MGITNFDELELQNASTATASSGAATCNAQLFRVTSESLNTAAAGEYTLTLTNSKIDANSVVIASAGLGSATTGTPGIGGITVSAGQAVITVTNLHVSAAFNGTIVVSGFVLNMA